MERLLFDSFADVCAFNMLRQHAWNVRWIRSVSSCCISENTLFYDNIRTNAENDLSNSEPLILSLIESVYKCRHRICCLCCFMWCVLCIWCCCWCVCFANVAKGKNNLLLTRIDLVTCGSCEKRCTNRARRTVTRQMGVGIIYNHIHNNTHNKILHAHSAIRQSTAFSLACLFHFMVRLASYEPMMFFYARFYIFDNGGSVTVCLGRGVSLSVVYARYWWFKSTHIHKVTTGCNDTFYMLIIFCMVSISFKFFSFQTTT